jgi:hypothetical protein
MSSILFIFNNNSSILDEYKKQYNRFFSRPDINVIIYCSSSDLVSHAQQSFQNSIVKYISTCTNSYTSFLHFLSDTFSSNKERLYKFLYKIETKSKNIKFGEIGQLIYNWRLIEDNLNSTVPLLCGSNANKTENTKLFLRKDVLSIIDKNHLDKNNLLYSFVDKYTFDIFDEKTKQIFRVDPDFYSFYESDLRKANLSKEDSINHWRVYGCNELHRVSHPFMVESYGKSNFFISGANFCMNQACIQVLKENVQNWTEEMMLASENDAICSSWEILFGLIPYLFFGKVFGVENGVLFDSHGQNNNFDANIYRSANSDLSHMTTVDELKNHYNENGWAEDRTSSVRLLQKPQSIFYNKNFDANLAFFLKYPIQNSILKNLKFLLNKNFKLDIYVDAWEKTLKYKGYVLSPIEIESVKADLSLLFQDCLHNCNICLGFETYRNYKCAFVQEGIMGVENVKKSLNLKVLKFLNDQTLIDFVEEQLNS